MRAVKWALLLLSLSPTCRAESAEESARSLAKKILARLTPNETAHVTSRNLSSLSPAEADKAQTALGRTLTRRIKNPDVVEIALTISENVRGYLLVAEIRRENEKAVEMVEFRPDPPPAAAPARSVLAIEKRLLWEQDAPILDLALMAERMLVLDTTGLTRYDRRDGGWINAGFAPIDAPLVRDPRGRMEAAGDALAVYLPTATCHGTWNPVLSLQCSPGSSEFTIDQRSLRFTSARNTIEGTEGFEAWSGDSAVISTSCAGRKIAASGVGDRGAADFVALYDAASNGPVRVSDPVEFPGPVMALWPQEGRALAVIRILSTGRYAAYSLTLDCGR